MYRNGAPLNLQVLYGSVETSEAYEYVEVETMIAHPDFDGEHAHNDIGLILTKENIKIDFEKGVHCIGARRGGYGHRLR